MNWATIVLRKQTRLYPKAAESARCRGWRALSESVRFCFPFYFRRRESLSLLVTVCGREREGGAEEGNAAQSPSLNSSERGMAKEEMRRRGEITKTNVCPRSIWKPDPQCVGKNLSSVPGAVSGGCMAQSAPPFYQTTSHSCSSAIPPRHIA